MQNIKIQVTNFSGNIEVTTPPKDFKGMESLLHGVLDRVVSVITGFNSPVADDPNEPSDNELIHDYLGTLSQEQRNDILMRYGPYDNIKQSEWDDIIALYKPQTKSFDNFNPAA